MTDLNPIEGHLVFPNIAASLGGAVRVAYTARVARIYLPAHREPVRMLRSQLPPIGKWTSFNLAEAALAYLATA